MGFKLLDLGFKSVVGQRRLDVSNHSKFREFILTFAALQTSMIKTQSVGI